MINASFLAEAAYASGSVAVAVRALEAVFVRSDGRSSGALGSSGFDEEEVMAGSGGGGGGGGGAGPSELAAEVKLATHLRLAQMLYAATSNRKEARWHLEQARVVVGYLAGAAEAKYEVYALLARVYLLGAEAGAAALARCQVTDGLAAAEVALAGTGWGEFLAGLRSGEDVVPPRGGAPPPELHVRWWLALASLGVRIEFEAGLVEAGKTLADAALAGVAALREVSSNGRGGRLMVAKHVFDLCLVHALISQCKEEACAPILEKVVAETAGAGEGGEAPALAAGILQIRVHALILQSVTLLRKGVHVDAKGVQIALGHAAEALAAAPGRLESPVGMPWMEGGEVFALVELLRCQLYRGTDMSVAAAALEAGRGQVRALRAALEAGEARCVPGAEVPLALRRLLVIELCFFEIEFQLCLNSFKVKEALLTLHALFAHCETAPSFLRVYRGLLHAWLGDFCVAAGELDAAAKQYALALEAAAHDPRVAMYAQLGRVKVLLYQAAPQEALVELEAIFESHLRRAPHYETFVAEYALLRAQIETHLPKVTLTALNSVIDLLEASLAKVSQRLLDAFMETQIHSVLGSCYWLKKDTEKASAYLLGSLYSAQSSLLIDANNLALLAITDDGGAGESSKYAEQKALIDDKIASLRTKVSKSSYFRLTSWDGSIPGTAPEPMRLESRW
ncbi:uncharacterized protein AMSG_10475 [Thecamonas trahens ATCC 50062]|uniref:Uncharacterized protein n=1 Tax=Thecamonas trahens ATCC 50062 TaxID=461836 RepID=A0A0L0DSP6_THETB|nr:hypothetical protein AMSG_10475 [Thecamonas trahens ATCC 50062]KNC54478.1 hypothetical protein AMSG_10475 [Thecamonas trahens ATCC 50062]|eukprot:XP_013753632.1 hypothetical protein AMSG_10475 [Thecamonas trahens ATCC 50062]